MTESEKRFWNLLAEELENPCPDTYPEICELLNTDHGRTYVENMIFSMANEDGLGIQQAMAQLESELGY